jgi:signal transduction histidine kinase
VTDAQRRDLERIKASQQHLLGLISGMLDLSRIESGTVSYHLAPVAIDPLLTSLDALVAPQAAAKELALHYAPSTPDLAVLADREKLRQVLLNLISNAIRFTPPGGRVTLTAETRDAGTVAVMVEDTGVGIPDEKLEHIFEPFVQLDRSLTQVREGVGLGLAISRDLARGMGGELTVESAIGKGSCFTLTLPRTADTPEAMATSGEMPALRARG